MYKFVVLSVVALAACVSGAPGGLVVPVAPAVAIAHTVPVGSSYSNTYRAPVVKAVPVVHAAPVVHVAPVVHAAHPVVAAPLVAAHPIVKTSHQLIAHPSPALIKAVTHVGTPAIPVTPVLHSAPLAHYGLGLPVSGYASHYNVQPIVKTHVAAAPLTLVR